MRWPLTTLRRWEALAKHNDDLNDRLVRAIQTRDRYSDLYLSAVQDRVKLGATKALLEGANDSLRDKLCVTTVQRDAALEEARAWKERHTRLAAVYEESLQEAERLEAERRAAVKQSDFSVRVQAGFLAALEDQKRKVLSLQATVRRYRGQGKVLPPELPPEAVTV